ncbi:YggS family pyridoxal phosphate-dependent enzyme [Methylophaga sp.]|uniref:YggS family pyridoxal phosphate-dependent enzyme n=1 Tax=Methylophaga sp. TaxID=2024840 RepID=UPI003F69C903
MTEIKKRFETIQDGIRTATTDANRPEKDVHLLAVSKTWPAEKLRDLADLGQRRFGENYLQEAIEKIDSLKELNLEWHFIGPIQSNKTRDIAAFFSWAQSVDRLKIAKRLNDQRPDDLPPLNVCIQVNIDNEETKSGVITEDVIPLAEAIQEFERLKLRGLMIIPARHDNETDQADSFKRAHALYQNLQNKFESIDTLSMGMTADMALAIEHGSTMVRIGTALFGQRHTRQSQ